MESRPIERCLYQETSTRLPPISILNLVSTSSILVGERKLSNLIQGTGVEFKSSSILMGNPKTIKLEKFISKDIEFLHKNQWILERDSSQAIEIEDDDSDKQLEYIDLESEICCLNENTINIDSNCDEIVNNQSTKRNINKIQTQNIISSSSHPVESIEEEKHPQENILRIPIEAIEKEQNIFEAELNELMNSPLKRKIKLLDKIKFTRWGRKDDCVAFSKIREICDQFKITVEDLYSVPDTTGYEQVWNKICVECNWKRENIFLKKRFDKLCKNSTFSVREMKLMKRLVKKQKRNDDINWNKVAYFFPGKSTKAVMDGFINDQRRRCYDKSH